MVSGRSITRPGCWWIDLRPAAPVRSPDHRKRGWISKSWRKTTSRKWVFPNRAQHYPASIHMSGMKRFFLFVMYITSRTVQMGVRCVCVCLCRLRSVQKLLIIVQVVWRIGVEATQTAGVPIFSSLLFFFLAMRDIQSSFPLGCNFSHPALCTEIGNRIKLVAWCGQNLWSDDWISQSGKASDW